jgi:hypothetical protein
MTAQTEETTSRYFRVHFDGKTDHWFPDEPETDDGDEVDARDFTDCVHYNGPTPLLLRTNVRGARPSVLLGPFDMPVVDLSPGEALAARVGQSIQLVPAHTDDGDAVYILNVLDRVACIDEASTVGDFWQPADGRPDKLGAYRMIIELALDPGRISSRLFRVASWEIALIAEETVATEFFAAVPGLKLTQVA